MFSLVRLLFHCVRKKRIVIGQSDQADPDFEVVLVGKTCVGGTFFVHGWFRYSCIHSLLGLQLLASTTQLREASNINAPCNSCEVRGVRSIPDSFF